MFFRMCVFTGVSVAFLGLSLPCRWFTGGSVPEGICVKGISSPDSRTISMIPHCGIREGPLLCMKLQHTFPTRCSEGPD